jgi:hypothetical protein
MQPLVGLVTLTIPGREDFLALRKKEAKRQTYPRIEHIIVCRPGVPKGQVRNEAAELAIKAGADIIINADDDDMLLPTSVERRVGALVAGAELCSTSTWYAYDMRGGYGVLIEYAHCHDAPLAYWARVWQERPFDSKMRVSEVAKWMRAIANKVTDLKDVNLFVYMMHGKNYFARTRLCRTNQRDVTREVHQLMGGDLGWYLSRQEVPYCEEPTAHKDVTFLQ